MAGTDVVSGLLLVALFGFGCALVASAIQNEVVVELTQELVAERDS